MVVLGKSLRFSGMGRFAVLNHVPLYGQGILRLVSTTSATNVGVMVPASRFVSAGGVSRFELDALHRSPPENVSSAPL